MKSFLAIILSLLLLTTSMGFTWGTHYCFGRKVESKLTLGKGDLGCGMMELQKRCSKSNSEDGRDHVNKTPCCQNHYQSLNIEDGFQSTPTKIDVAPILALVICFVDINHAFSPQHQTRYIDYPPPPPLGANIQVLYQTFLI